MPYLCIGITSNHHSRKTYAHYHITDYGFSSHAGSIGTGTVKIYTLDGLLVREGIAGRSIGVPAGAMHLVTCGAEARKVRI